MSKLIILRNKLILTFFFSDFFSEVLMKIFNEIYLNNSKLVFIGKTSKF